MKPLKYLFFALPAFATYVGNPADPAIMNRGLFSSCYPFVKGTSGYLYDYTNDKNYVTDDKAIKKFGLLSQMTSASLIFMERLSVYGMFGGSKEQIEERSIYENILDKETNYHFSWILGSKLILFHWMGFYLGADFSYFSVPSSSKSFFKNLNRLNLSIDDKIRFSMDEWQLSFGGALNLHYLCPYGGISYLESKLIADGNYKTDHNIGYFYGLTISLTGKIHFNVEKRLENESGYSIKGSLVF